MAEDSMSSESSVQLEGHQQPKKRSCVKRALSGYNLFCRDQSALPAMKAFNVPDRFRGLAEGWKALSEEERSCWNQRARECPGQEVDKKKETRKSLEKMISIIYHLRSVDSECQAFFVCVGGDGESKRYGGSDEGRAFLESRMEVMDDFKAFVDANKERVTSSRRLPAISAQQIRKVFNSKYASAVQNPKAKMPYSSLGSRGVMMEGMPDDLPIRSPGEYGTAQRRKIWDSRDQLRCMVEK